MFGPLLEIFVCVSVHKVLDGSESQYSGMQIGTLQDEEDEAAAAAASSSQEEPPEPPFLQSALGASVYTNTLGSCYRSRSAANRSSASIVPLVPAPVLFTALSKPHLFEGRGHNRQGSDSSVERFIPKDEPAEPEPDNKVSFSHWIFLLGLIKFPESKIEVKGDVNGRCIWLSNFFLLLSHRGSRAQLDITPTREWSHWCTAYGYLLLPFYWQDKRMVRDYRI